MRINFKPGRKSKDASAHFSQVAELYHDLRTTDQKPLICIKDRLRHLATLPSIDVADVGCGNGRYSLLLARRLSGRIRLTCVDNNERMLDMLTDYLGTTSTYPFEVIKSRAERIPIDKKSFDVVTTFNAVHHFMLKDFLAEAARILKDDGLLFIYTRTPEQNSRNIWGKHFPKFCQKETRLLSEKELERKVDQSGHFNLESSVYFKHRRMASLNRLVEQAEGHHYSTFWFYSEKEFSEAVGRFRENIVEVFADPGRVRWVDENVLYILEKRSKTET